MQSFESPVMSLVTVARSPQHNRAQRHAAFAQLVGHFYGMACAYAQQLLGDAQLAQDATQEAFLAAYQQLAELREPAAFPGWLRRIVHTQCHRLLRTKRLDAIPLSGLAHTLASENDLAEVVADADAAQATVDAVMAAIADLPEHERAVVRLFYFDDYSIREVAETLGLPVTTIKKRLQYARMRLRNQLIASCQLRDQTIQRWLLSAGQWFLSLSVVIFVPQLCPIPVSVTATGTCVRRLSQ